MSKKMNEMWDSPLEWLIEKSSTMSQEQLRQDLLILARLHDSDTLQDIYQHDMGIDGYFDEV